MNKYKKKKTVFYIKYGQIVEEDIFASQDYIILYYDNDNSHLISSLEINEFSKISVHTEILKLKRVGYNGKILDFEYTSRDEFETALLFNHFKCIIHKY